MTSPDAAYGALRHGLGAVITVRDVVNATGADTTEFLQGQLSQDLSAMDVGASLPSLLLQPQGKMEALLRVSRRREDEWLLDMDAGYGEAVVARLNRFKLRTACELAVREVRAVLVRGAGALDVDAAEALISAPVDWGGLPGRDLVGDEVVRPAAATECTLEDLEVVRIEAGVAAMGSEIDETTIPAEADVVDGAVSFTKGCYTGQELVARIDSRGANTPRRLRGLVFAAPSPVPSPGATVLADSADEVGRVTSAAYSPGHEAAVALAYLGRAVEPGAEVSVAGSVAAVHELPMFAD